MYLYSQQQLYLWIAFILPHSLTGFQSVKGGHPIFDVKWSYDINNTAKYVGVGQTFTSLTPELHMKWHHPLRTASFRPDQRKTYPSRNIKKFDFNLPKSNEPTNQNSLQPRLSNFNSRPQVLCNAVVQNQLFSLKSPLYPQHYPENIRCLYVFKKTYNVCSLEFEIRDFYLEPTVDCSKDWLRIGDRRYCGFHRPRKLLVAANKFQGQDVTIEFRSDSAHQFRGFYIIGRQIPCPLNSFYNPGSLKTSEQRPFRPHVSFTVPFPVPYAPRPSFTASPPSGLVIKYPRINPAPSPISPQHKILSKYPTPRPYPPYFPPTYTSESPITHPTPTQTPPPLTTPSFTYCDATFNTPEGQFQSVNYPQNYGPNLSCEIRFFPANDSFCVLELYFQDFLLEQSKGCSKDALIIGGNRYCSSSLIDQRLRISFVSQSSISLQFVTDATGSERGFKFRFRMLPCEGFSTTNSPNTTPPGVTCDRVFSDRENTITSVNYPLPYLKNLDCIYTIEKWSLIVDELEIYFAAFDLQNGTDCVYDYLEIDGRRYCGDQTGLRLRVPFPSDNPFEILFHSDGSVQQTGFNISILQLDRQVTSPRPPTTPPPVSVCRTETYSESSFLIISPQFPQRYDPGQDCSYSVIRRSKDVCELQLKFVFFYLPEAVDTECREDYLEINNIRYCGVLSGQTRNVPFDSFHVDIRFHSGWIDNEAEGFSIHVVQLTDCTVPPQETNPLPPRIEESLCETSFLPEQGTNTTEVQSRNNGGCMYVRNEEPAKNYANL
ncbi:cubilin-like [Daphnia carinata]|uniref:cubilin-like n=1 Tax=Daphnia carinata TaxID=120202 RepID=UPI00257DF7F6|nr:cubilin-like [Daphnia carinata]